MTANQIPYWPSCYLGHLSLTLVENLNGRGNWPCGQCPDVKQVHGVGHNALAKLKSYCNAPPKFARIRIEVERLAKLLAGVEDFAKISSSCIIDSGLAEQVSLAASQVPSIN